MEARVRLTTKCNMDCEYCFAKEFKSRKVGDISLSNVDILIEKFRESHIDTLKIQGGEPTCHKQFPEISKKLKSSGFKLHLYTNGMFDVNYVDVISANYNSVIININQLSKDNLSVISRNIDKLVKEGCSIMLGKTISEESCDVRDFFDFADKYKNFVKIRLDASRPGHYADDEFFRFSNNAQLVVSSLFEARLMGFEVEVDCCFPPCIFHEGEWKLIRRHLRGFWSKCTTIIDISPDLRVTTCFCGARFSGLTIYDFNNLTEAQLFAEYIENKMRFSINSHDNCSTCEKKIYNICQGGCVGHKKTELRYVDKSCLKKFREFLKEIQGDNSKIMSNNKIPLSSKFILISKNQDIDVMMLQSICMNEIYKEPENPFVYIYVASHLYGLSFKKLAFQILGRMPNVDNEANQLKNKLLLKIGVEKL